MLIYLPSYVRSLHLALLLINNKEQPASLSSSSNDQLTTDSPSSSIAAEPFPSLHLNGSPPPCSKGKVILAHMRSRFITTQGSGKLSPAYTDSPALLFTRGGFFLKFLLFWRFQKRWCDQFRPRGASPVLNSCGFGSYASQVIKLGVSLFIYPIIQSFSFNRSLSLFRRWLKIAYS